MDLVVLDVELPDMSGFDVCDRIKGDPRQAQPVIHLSASSVRGEDRAQGRRPGADAYLVEPVDPDELLATVNTILRNNRARTAAEGLADRLARLTKATLAMNSAADFDALVLAIATGAATIVSSPTVALVISPDGQLRRARVDPADVDSAVLDTVPMRLLKDLTAPSAGRVRGSVRLSPSNGGWWHRNRTSPESRWPRCSAPVPGSRSPSCCGPPDWPRRARSCWRSWGMPRCWRPTHCASTPEEHTLALTLQRSFLTEPPESIGDVELGVRYVPAARNAGHLPPLLVEPHRAGYLEVSGRMLGLAASAGKTRWWTCPRNGRS